MKKILKVVMALGLIFALTACGGKKTQIVLMVKVKKGKVKKLKN